MARATARPIFMVFGSSIVLHSFDEGGWGSILAHTYAHKADFVLRGYDGWNSRQALQVLDEVFPKVAAVQPSLVIAYFGGNDSFPPRLDGTGPHVTLPEFIENMTKIATHIKCVLKGMPRGSYANTNVVIVTKSLSEETRIIFLSTPAISEKMLLERSGEKFLNSGLTNQLRRQYSDAWVEKCSELGFKVVDMWTALQQPDDWETACFSDGLHLSAVGSSIVAKEIKRILKEVDWKPSLNWELMTTEFPDDSVPSDHLMPRRL